MAHRLLYNSTLGSRVIKKEISGPARGSRIQVDCFAELLSGSEEGSYSRLIDLCNTQL